MTANKPRKQPILFSKFHSVTGTKIEAKIKSDRQPIACLMEGKCQILQIVLSEKMPEATAISIITELAQKYVDDLIKKEDMKSAKNR